MRLAHYSSDYHLGFVWAQSPLSLFSLETGLICQQRLELSLGSLPQILVSPLCQRAGVCEAKL